MFFNKHYPCLDMLRSIAITLVMLAHFNAKLYPLPKTGFFQLFVSKGWNGVGLFFALSGFLIGGQIIEALQRDSFSFKIFYIKRFWRIFPPYYFSLLIVIIIYFIGLADNNVIQSTKETPIILRALLYHVFYLQNYIQPPILQAGLYWSLALEEQFYILAPVLLYIVWRYFKPFFTLILTGLILLAMTIRFLLYTPSVNWLYDIRFPFQTRFDSLLFGVLAAYLFIFYNRKLKDSSLVRVMLFLSSFAAIVVFMAVDNETNGYFNTCWFFSFTGFGFAALTLSLVISSFDLYIHRYLKKFFTLVARLSYTMYLYHLIFIFPVGEIIIKVHKYFGFQPSITGFIISFVVYFGAVLLISALVYRVIDRPAMNYRNKILSKSLSKGVG